MFFYEQGDWITNNFFCFLQLLLTFLPFLIPHQKRKYPNFFHKMQQIFRNTNLDKKNKIKMDLKKLKGTQKTDENKKLKLPSNLVELRRTYRR